MQVSIKNGVRAIKLTEAEKRLLGNAQTLIAEIGGIGPESIRDEAGKCADAIEKVMAKVIVGSVVEAK